MIVFVLTIVSCNPTCAVIAIDVKALSRLLVHKASVINNFTSVIEVELLICHFLAAVESNVSITILILNVSARASLLMDELEGCLSHSSCVNERSDVALSELLIKVDACWSEMTKVSLEVVATFSEAGVNGLVPNGTITAHDDLLVFAPVTISAFDVTSTTAPVDVNALVVL